MKYRKGFIVMLYALSTVSALAQTVKTDTIFIDSFFGNSNLEPDRFYKLKNGDSLKIETLSFYISEIELLKKETVVWKEHNSFHLIDAFKSNSLKIPSGLQYDHIKFNLGIDSTTNVSGAMGGDLDPTRGMYWTWQSGYINFKLEGISNQCKNNKNEFTFHIGGYQQPFNSLQTILLSAKKKGNTTIVLDIEKLISQLNLSRQNHVMSPDKEAVAISKKISTAFSIR
jgi:hypothetical protein